MSHGASSDIEAEARRLRQTLDGMDEAFVLVSEDWFVRDMNTALQLLDGRPAARIIGRDLFEVWPGLRGSHAEQVFRRAMASRDAATVHYRYVDDRRDMWLDTRIFPSGTGLALFTQDATARVRMERRLREVEADSAVAIQAARLGTWTYFPDSGVLYCNDRHRELLGFDHDAPLSYSLLLERIDPTDRAQVAQAVVAATDPEGSGDLEVEYRTLPSQGAPARWIATFGRARFEGGICVRLAGVVRDITERRRAQTELEQSEARFRAIAEAMPLIVFMTDSAGANTYVNPRFADYTGIAAPLLLGDGWLVALHPQDRAQATETCRRAVTDGAVYQSEFRLARHDGQYRWFLARGIPWRATGEATQWFGACTDIQDLVEARQVLARDREQLEALVAERAAALDRSTRRLHESEARMRAVFENASDFLLVLRVEGDSEHIYVDLNAKAAAAMGRPREEIVGRTSRDVIADPGVADEIEHHCRRALSAGGAPYRYTGRRAYMGGSVREIEATMVAFAGPGGERLLLISAQDVTEQRVLEEALRQSQKMDAVGQLTGGIAHDFNNLLTGISGSLELMQGRLARGQMDQLDRHVVAALDAVRRAAALTHRLLTFARRQTLDPRPADLNHLVRGLEEIVRRTVGPAIALETRLDTRLWPTLCDANQLENALLNLCINARDAMPEGGRLLIETANVVLDALYCTRNQDARPGEYAVVSVTDSGIGMTPEVVSRAFEPFFTTKPLGQGTGLGLSMLYGFATQSGGHVRIDSAPGRGTTVSVHLPRGTMAETGTSASEEVPVPSAPQAAKTVLVVEDEPVIRALVVEVLSELGHASVEAGDGLEALRVLGATSGIDLLLTDVGLPGMNGRQLADAAREQRPELKILFMTGYAHNAAVGPGMMQPGMELLGKPFALETLAGKLRTMLAD